MAQSDQATIQTTQMTITNRFLIRSENGQAVIETTVAILVLTIFITALLFSLYLLSLKIWLGYSSHELLLCRQYQTPSQCDQNFKNQLKQFQKWGKLSKLDIYQKHESQNIKMKFEFLIWHTQKIEWNFEKQIHFPLELNN